MAAIFPETWYAKDVREDLGENWQSSRGVLRAGWLARNGGGAKTDWLEMVMPKTFPPDLLLCPSLQICEMQICRI